MNASRPNHRKLVHGLAGMTGMLLLVGYLGWFWYAVATATGSAVVKVASLALGVG